MSTDVVTITPGHAVIKGQAITPVSDDRLSLEEAAALGIVIIAHALDESVKALSQLAADAIIGFANWANQCAHRSHFDDPHLMHLRLTTRSRAVRRWNRKRRRR